MFQKKVAKKNQNTYFISIHFFFRKSCHLLDNVKRYGRTRQATDNKVIERMCFWCWITKTTDTHSKYVILITFPGDNGYANASQQHVIGALPFFFSSLWTVVSVTFVYATQISYVSAPWCGAHRSVARAVWKFLFSAPLRVRCKVHICHYECLDFLRAAGRAGQRTNKVEWRRTTWHRHDWKQMVAVRHHQDFKQS
jgi:hypothetical protein